MSNYVTVTTEGQPNPSASSSTLSAAQLAEATRTRLQAFISPLLSELDRVLDARLVRTVFDLLKAILCMRDRHCGLLLSELGGCLLGPEHAPAGTKRISNLLRSSRWSTAIIERFLWKQAEKRLEELEENGQDALLLWDTSVQEKVESRKAEGLCSVRSSKAARCLKVRPGFYRPPTRRPIFVPGLHWLALLLIGRSGPPTVASMQWWTRRGEHAETEGEVHVRMLQETARRFGTRVLHVFDRGYCDAPWLLALCGFEVRFLVRFRKDWHLKLREESEESVKSVNSVNSVNSVASAEAVRPVAAWKLTRGKRSRDKRLVRDGRTGAERLQGVLWLPVEHPKLPGIALWLVVSRPGKHRPPWYLLTTEPVENATDAWRVVFAYARRWQIEQCFRYNKSELGMESPRLWTWERRYKLLLIVTLCYVFLLSLLDPLLEWLKTELLHLGCHRTGKRSRETPAPLYRLRSALSYLLTVCPQLPAGPSLQSSG